MSVFKGIVGLQKTSFIDYPGVISSVIFYNGCNLRCPYCHNVSLLDKKESIFDIERYVKDSRKYVDGIVITGGEPTLQEGLWDLVEYLKEDLGYKVKLDSNGLRPEVVDHVDWDYLAIDLKTNLGNYEKILGGEIGLSSEVVRTIDIVKQNKLNSEIRITCAPGIVSMGVIEDMLPLLEGVGNVILQKFKFDPNILKPDYFHGKSISDEEINEMKLMIDNVVTKCTIR